MVYSPWVFALAGLILFLSMSFNIHRMKPLVEHLTERGKVIAESAKELIDRETGRKRGDNARDEGGNP